MNFEPDELERDLRQALAREPAPVGFAARVQDRVAQREAQRSRSQRSRAWMTIAAMLVLAVLVTGSARQYQRARQERAARAGRELVLALRITSVKLHTAQKLIRRRANGV